MNQPADTSTFRALHRLVEHYTPNGVLGRTLLGGTALSLAPFLFFGGIEMISPAATFGAFVTGLFATAVGIPAFLLGVFTLWPVYLSLIGNVESAAAYPDGAAEAQTDVETPEAVLKRRYAAGELSREEFERRLGDVMGTDGADRQSVRTAEETRREDRSERVRNR
ncbi:SHOCT domain-containing protein [Halorussus sp. MSC15.2]|uniref:SHOCT domain-containing protein n=1 Tax=Halorussus sp. MSC15.2 TaxID=2283638 RepID=UPI0013D037D8|nr:SHOCT domain-containing protein [Halorussus sp. MSC15.2]NEU57407.1 SHOCT domain-containing protein [Halorussus sp. MSC15.2]